MGKPQRKFQKKAVGESKKAAEKVKAMHDSATASKTAVSDPARPSVSSEAKTISRAVSGAEKSKPVLGKAGKAVHSESKKAGKAALRKTRIRVGDLISALNDSDVQKIQTNPLNTKNPKHFTGRVKDNMVRSEGDQFRAVWGMPSFRSNPLDAISQHIQNTIKAGHI